MMNAEERLDYVLQEVMAKSTETDSSPRDFVSLQDYEDAIRLLTDGTAVDEVEIWLKDSHNTQEYGGLEKRAFPVGDLALVGPYGKEWLQHAATHLKAKVDRYFRDALVPRDQQQFLAMMKTMAHGYQEDAQALKWAAARLHKHGDLHGANTTQKAAIVAAKAAQELIGED